MPSQSERPSQFYTGLVADLYEPLVSERARAEDYVGFLDRACQRNPQARMLELCCGSGLPLLDLVERGYRLEGLDASLDMLEICRSRAQERGLAVTLHHGEMQSFELPQRYDAIFIAGASFTLLTSDEDAMRAIARIHAHLVPGGSALITLEITDPTALERWLGRVREVTRSDGTRLRVSMTALTPDADGRGLTRKLRYERIAPDGTEEIVERDWRTRWWPQDELRRMLGAAGFDKVTIVASGGGAAAPDASVFTALATRTR